MEFGAHEKRADTRHSGADASWGRTKTTMTRNTSSSKNPEETLDPRHAEELINRLNGVLVGSEAALHDDEVDAIEDTIRYLSQVTDQ